MSKHAKQTDWQGIHTCVGYIDFTYTTMDYKTFSDMTKWAINHPEYDYTGISELMERHF